MTTSPSWTTTRRACVRRASPQHSAAGYHEYIQQLIDEPRPPYNSMTFRELSVRVLSRQRQRHPSDLEGRLKYRTAERDDSERRMQGSSRLLPVLGQSAAAVTRDSTSSPSSSSPNSVNSSSPISLSSLPQMIVPKDSKPVALELSTTSIGDHHHFLDEQSFVNSASLQSPLKAVGVADSTPKSHSSPSYFHHLVRDEGNILDVSTTRVHPSASETDGEAPPLPVPVCQWEGCDLQFPSLHQLVSHLEHQHTLSLQTYVCYWRGCTRKRKPFDARYKLITHLRCHTGERPYKCSHAGCSRRFSRLENLKLHTRTHTGEKPYTCHHEGCTKRFNNTSDRAKHMKTHITKKPYACKHPGCDKAYTDPSSMRKHTKFAHKIKPRMAVVSNRDASISSPTSTSNLRAVTSSSPVTAVESHALNTFAPLRQQTPPTSAPSPVYVVMPVMRNSMTSSSPQQGVYQITTPTSTFGAMSTQSQVVMIHPHSSVGPPQMSTMIPNVLGQTVPTQPLVLSPQAIVPAPISSPFLLQARPQADAMAMAMNPFVYQPMMVTRPVQQVVLPVLPVTQVPPDD